MTKLRVHCFCISLDGYGAGPNQSLDNPLGVVGENLHGWFVATRAFKELFGKEGGTTGPDNDFAARATENIGAWILGRNMFGPIRGSWPDDAWKGWWGEEPPYHSDVFVLTHHPRAPIVMKGGTTFHFVTDGIHAALERARKSAGDRDVRASAAEPPPSANISRRASSTRCTSPSRRCCSGAASTCSAGSTCWRSATSAPSTSTPPPRPTWC